MIALIVDLERWCAPWKQLYSDSKVLETGVTALHVVATLVGGGIAVAADRHTILAWRRGGPFRPSLLDDLRATHRPVLIALALLFVSGVALATADVETFAKSPVFLLKLALVLLLCLNGLWFTRTERQLRHRMIVEGRQPEQCDDTAELWRRLHGTSWLSIALWISTTVVGTALVNA